MICHSSGMNSAIQKRASPCVGPREGVRTDTALGVTGKCLSRDPNLHQGQTWLVYQERALRRDFQLVLLQASSSLAKSFPRRGCGVPGRRFAGTRVTVWHPQEAAVQVQLPFGAKVQFSAAPLFPWGSFELG